VKQIHNAHFRNIWGGGGCRQCCFSHLNILVLTFLRMEMMGLSTEKTFACFPGSLLFSLEGIVGLCEPVLTLDRLALAADPEACFIIYVGF